MLLQPLIVYENGCSRKLELGVKKVQRIPHFSFYLSWWCVYMCAYCKRSEELPNDFQCKVGRSTSRFGERGLAKPHAEYQCFTSLPQWFSHLHQKITFSHERRPLQHGEVLQSCVWGGGSKGHFTSRGRAKEEELGQGLWLPRWVKWCLLWLQAGKIFQTSKWGTKISIVFFFIYNNIVILMTKNIDYSCYTLNLYVINI